MCFLFSNKSGVIIDSLICLSTINGAESKFETRRVHRELETIMNTPTPLQRHRTCTLTQTQKNNKSPF